MARTTITIPTASAIDMLRERITESNLWEAEHEKITKEYEVAKEKWIQAVIAKMSKLTPTDTNVSHSRYGKPSVSVGLTFNAEDLPPAPESRTNPYRSLNMWEVRELEGMIKLLQAHTEPVVGAGTLNKMSKFL